MDDIIDSVCQSKEPRLSKTVVPSSKGISPSPANDNMIQERYIHSRRGLPKLPGKLYIRSAGRWISGRMVV